MTIIQNESWVQELLTKFNVLKVRWEPHCESTWTIQYQDCEPFKLDEKAFDTIEEDEQLVGGEIKAEISLSVEEILPTTKKEKSFSYEGGWITVTGIYEDIIISEWDGKIYMSYKLDSVFPLEISDIPEGAQIGDWITVTGEPTLILPRERREEMR